MKPKFEGQREANVEEIPKGHIVVMQLTSDGDHSISIGWSDIAIGSLTLDHLKTILYLVEDSFYRRKPELRRQ